MVVFLDILSMHFFGIKSSPTYSGYRPEVFKLCVVSSVGQGNHALKKKQKNNIIIIMVLQKLKQEFYYYVNADNNSFFITTIFA